MRAKLEWELTQAALGSPSFLHEGTDDGSLPTPCADATPSAVNLEQEARAAEAALLEVPRGKRPLSLWDWVIWTKARPAMPMTSYMPLFDGVIYNVPTRSHTDEHLLTKIADGSFDEQSLSLAASHSPPSLAPIVGFPPKDATETSHPSPSQSYLPDWRTHSAPHHITTMPLEKKHQPPIPPFTHPPPPPSPISLRPSHQDTSQLPPPPYPSMGWWAFWSSFSPCHSRRQAYLVDVW